eukprot:4797902-Amphidinium_carterae.2
MAAIDELSKLPSPGPPPCPDLRSQLAAAPVRKVIDLIAVQWSRRLFAVGEGRLVQADEQ